MAAPRTSKKGKYKKNDDDFNTEYQREYRTVVIKNALIDDFVKNTPALLQKSKDVENSYTNYNINKSKANNSFKRLEQFFSKNLDIAANPDIINNWNNIKTTLPLSKLEYVDPALRDLVDNNITSSLTNVYNDIKTIDNDKAKIFTKMHVKFYINEINVMNNVIDIYNKLITSNNYDNTTEHNLVKNKIIEIYNNANMDKIAADQYTILEIETFKKYRIFPWNPNNQKSYVPFGMFIDELQQ
jgi:hypothetical protein